MTQVEGLSAVAPPTHLVTHETEIIDHLITDDQLMQLARGGKDKSFEIAVGAGGAAIGLAQNFATLVKVTMAGQAITLGTLFGGSLFLISATAAVFAFLSYLGTKGEVGALVARIKGRRAGTITPASSSSVNTATPSA